MKSVQWWTLFCCVDLQGSLWFNIFVKHSTYTIMKIIELPCLYEGFPLSLAWYGYSTIVETYSFRIFTLNKEYLSSIIVDWDIISIMDMICSDFPEYAAIERAAADGPVVELAEARLKTNRIAMDQIPFVIEATFFKTGHIMSRQYINAGEETLGYRVVFRFAESLQAPVSEDNPPLFNPRTDRLFILSNKFIV